MEDNNINNNNKLNQFKQINYSENNPNIIYKEVITDDCIYDYFQNNFNFDVYTLKNENEKIFISYISKKENNIINIIEFNKENINSNINNILTLKDHKHAISSIKHYFNPYTNKDYLLSTDCKGNLLLHEILSINEYKLKVKIDSRNVRNKRWVCSTVNQDPFFPGMKNQFGFGCIYKPYNLYNPMKKNIFGFGNDKFGYNPMNFDYFENQMNFQEPAFVIDYIGSTLLFFTSTSNYIFILYRESDSIAILDLETAKNKGNIYSQNYVNSLVQWYNSEEDKNYLIVSRTDKIDILNPFLEKDKIIYEFKDNDNLKGLNCAYSILYNFRDNNDCLLSYNKYKINIINLNNKNILFSIKMKYNINSVLAWNKNYLIVSQGDNYSAANFTQLSVIDIESQKIISQITEKMGFVKSTIKKIKIFNNEDILFISDSEKKIKLWESIK